MRIWITKNGELPVREQLVRQVVLGILSEDLPAGGKLPSVRALARRHQIHANTVSAAYHDLLQQGWLELRRGSGLFVRPAQPSGERHSDLDPLLTALLQSALSRGYQPAEVLQRLEHRVRPRRYDRILIVEPDSAMGEILLAELTSGLGDVAVDVVNEPPVPGEAQAALTVVVTLPTRAAKLRRDLLAKVLCLPLRLRSVEKSLEGQTKPGPEVVIAIVSRSSEIRYWARAMLIAVGLDPQALCEIDAAEPDWRDRIGRAMVVVADIVAARALPAECRSKVFRIVADSSLEELKQLCLG